MPDDLTATNRPRRRRPTIIDASWVRTGLVLTCAFLLWLVMDATVLQHNATVISPLGARRTAALDLLDPLSDLSRWMLLDVPVSGANEALGRTADGGFVVPTVPTTTSTTLRSGTTTTTRPIRLVATAKHPLRILLVGDSIGEDLDGALLEDFSPSVTRVFTDDHIDTGLTRLDYFPWIAELEYDMYHDRPEVVIGMMGANDAQGFVDPPTLYGTPAWKAHYRRNVGQFFTIGQDYGAKMFWVSVPTISPLGRSEYEQLVRAIQERMAGRHHVFYIDSDKTLSPGGVYHEFLRINGQIVQVRVSDGIHLEPAGAALLANAVLLDVEKELRLYLR
jgi:lysophospholipase L1-like esterase